MLLNKTWHNSIYLYTIIKKGHAALSVNPYLGYIFDPIPLEKRVGIQEGSLCVESYTIGIPSWAPLAWLPWLVGPGLPLLMPSSLFGLNGKLTWMPSPADTHDKMICTTTMVTALLILLGLLHCSSKAYNDFIHHIFNSIRIFAFGTCRFIRTLFFQMHCSYSRGLGRLGAFSFCRGKKLIALGLLALSVVWLQEGPIASSSASLAAQR